MSRAVLTVHLKEDYIMWKSKKFGAIMSSSILALTMLAPVTSAQTPPQANDGLQIQVANVEINVSKEELIKKFKTLFPGKFDHLKNSDFQLGNTGHYYHDDPIMRYELSFNAKVNGKVTYGSVTFAGDNYEIEHFYYLPVDTKEALFPAKVSKEEAKEIATEFVNNLADGNSYKLHDDGNYIPPTVLTEPINYSFTFSKLHNGVPIADQYVYVTVLGTGDIINFSQPIMVKKNVTFDEATKVLNKEELLEKYKNIVSADLLYTVHYQNYQPTTELSLIYRPNASAVGIHALTGKWQTAKDFSSTLPVKKQVKPIVPSKLQPNDKPLTTEEAKKKAEKLLAIDSKNIKLVIHSVTENHYNGIDVISVHYMYETAMGGHGSTVDFVKATGEIIQFHNMQAEVLQGMGEEPEAVGKLSELAAKNFAIQHLKEHMPSVLHEYSEPLESAYFDKVRGSYSFVFPKIINGVPSGAHQISISVGPDGKLLHVYSAQQEVKNITPLDGIVSSEAAKNTILEALDLQLQYVRHGDNEQHYNLVYTPVYHNQSYSYVDAVTGELADFNGKELTEAIEHPFAAEELNYLVQTGILDLSKKENFNADASISKGEALQVLVKSLSYFYYDMYSHEGVTEEAISGISKDDPYYKVVERAVQLGIVDPQKDQLNVSAAVTKEELATWFIRLLGLSAAAEHSEIYKLNYTDGTTVAKDKVGYVALAGAMGLLETQSNEFKPKTEVTYAQLAVALIKLANELAEKNNNGNYYR